MRKLLLTLSIFILSFADLSAENNIKRIYEGKPDSKITILVFESLTCSHCATFHKNIYPEIKKLLCTMNKLYPKKNSFESAAVRMSGSGSSCFSLFEDKFSANLFNQKIQDAGYWSVSTKFITEF